MAKIALVTGANKGIGLETARQLAKGGIHVILAARDGADGAKTGVAMALIGPDGPNGSYSHLGRTLPW